jgi:hypothetical protein
MSELIAVKRKWTELIAQAKERGNSEEVRQAIADYRAEAREVMIRSVRVIPEC